MGLLCTVSCLASLALPDTRGKPLLLDLKKAEVFYTKERNALYRGLCLNKIKRPLGDVQSQKILKQVEWSSDHRCVLPRTCTPLPHFYL